MSMIGLVQSRCHEGSPDLKQFQQNWQDLVLNN